MKNPLYNDASIWDKLTLEQQVEAIRLHLCTGPCGQSSQVMQQRERINAVLRKVKALVKVQYS